MWNVHTVEDAFYMYQNSGYKTMPTPHQLTGCGIDWLPSTWRNDIFMMKAWYDFFYDWNKRPSEFK